LKGQNVKKLISVAHAGYADERADLYLGGTDVSPVTGHVFQAVLVRSNRAKPMFDYYLWELGNDGEKVNQWLIRAGISNEDPFPSHIVPTLRALPDGSILSVILYGLRQPKLVKIDAEGHMIFEKPLTAHDRLHPIFKSIIPAGDGQAFIVGQIRGKPAIVKIDEQGQFVFQKEIAGEGGGICTDGLRLSENRFRICGVTKDGDDIRSWVVDVDDQGELQREFVIDHAPWISIAMNLPIARLGSNRTAFVHPVTVDGKMYCCVTVLDDALKSIAEAKLCEVTGYAETFHVQRYDGDLVIVVQTAPQTISVFVVDENLKVKAQGVAEPLSVGSPVFSRLAVTGDRALILAQQGTPLQKEKHTIGSVALDLSDLRGGAKP